MGIRRRRHLLRTCRPSLAAAALGLFLIGCTGPSEEQEQKLALYKETCLAYYQQGNYVKALHQADLALSVDPEIPEMRIAKGQCYLKLGQISQNVELFDRSIAVFDELMDEVDPEEHFEAYLGGGSVHLARALSHVRQADAFENRLSGDFLDEQERDSETRRYEAEMEAHEEHLLVAEKAFRTVLSLERHQDNRYAMVDLCLVLTTMGDRDEEALDLANQALELIDENTRVNADMLSRNANLDATSRITVQHRLERNQDKSKFLRDLVITIHLNRGEPEDCLRHFAEMESQGLMGEVHYYNRAGIHETLGHWDAAISDLTVFLKERASYHESIEDDDMASDVMRRINDLRSRAAATPRP